MKNPVKISFIFLLAFFGIVNAQVVVQNDTISGTPYTISMDQKISKLMEDAEEKCARANISYKDNNTGGSKTKINVPEKNMSQAEICRKNPRIMGYKIQLAVVKSNEEAREVGMYFRRRFPNMKVEIDASLRPNYKVMAGSYLTKESAASDLKKIKEFFKSARPIQYRVFCVEAK